MSSQPSKIVVSNENTPSNPDMWLHVTERRVLFKDSWALKAKARIHVSCLSTRRTAYTKQGQLKPWWPSISMQIYDLSLKIEWVCCIGWWTQKYPGLSSDMIYLETKCWSATLTWVFARHSSRVYWQSQSEKHPVESWNEDTCRKIVNAAVGTEIPYDVISYRPWVISRKVAKQHRMGQVFLWVPLPDMKTCKWLTRY